MYSLEAHFFDADGTLNEIDIKGALAGKPGTEEIQHYYEAAIAFAAAKTEMAPGEVDSRLRTLILGEVFPQRAHPDFWGKLQGNRPTSPAVDHFLLIEAAVRRLHPVFNATPGLTSELFKAASAASHEHAAIDEDARGVLGDLISRNRIVGITTNSSTKKIDAMLRKAGLEAYTVHDRIAPGRIGVLGDAQKFRVDESMPDSPKEHLDLSPFYGAGIELDLRRGVFRKRVRQACNEAGVTEVRYVTDIPELDLYPMRAEFGDVLRCAMKLNPTSASETVNAVTAILKAPVGTRLSALVKLLDIQD
ncbi:hypothetical protein HYW83_02235 [Candidatus Peregrinibacteria bacterium]|nr:hypothetical protein [Candidatus Peregrinibacteria bacterium]